VLVGDDPASAIYINGKQKASAEAGIRGFDHRLPHDTEHREVSKLLDELNENPSVSGILLQLPTPPQVDGGALTERIWPSKDVDGLTPISAGLLAKGRPGLRPATPSGVMELLRRYDVSLEGAEAVVLGRKRSRRPARQRTPARRQRDGHDVPLADPQSSPTSAGAPMCSSPPSASRSLCAATGSRKVPW
jgi:hypothetical protein